MHPYFLLLNHNLLYNKHYCILVLVSLVDDFLKNRMKNVTKTTDIEFQEGTQGESP